MAAEELGRAVRQAREHKSATLRGVAEQTGLGHEWIAKLEQGLIAKPDPKKLQKLASALDVELEDFYALAGYLAPSGLPELKPYLRAKYDLPEPAAAELDDYLRRMQAKYDHTPSPPKRPKRREASHGRQHP